MGTVPYHHGSVRRERDKSSVVEKGEVMNDFLSRPATIGDVVVIASLIAFLMGLFTGIGVEFSAKEYARELLARRK